MEVDTYPQLENSDGLDWNTTIQSSEMDTDFSDTHNQPMTNSNSMSMSQDHLKAPSSAASTSHDHFPTTAVDRDSQRSLSSSLPNGLDDDPPPLIHYSRLRSMSMTREPNAPKPAASVPPAGSPSQYQVGRGLAALQLADNRHPPNPTGQVAQSLQLQALNTEPLRSTPSVPPKAGPYTTYRSPRPAGPSIPVTSSLPLARSNSLGSTSATMRSLQQRKLNGFSPGVSISMPASSMDLSHDGRSTMAQPIAAPHNMMPIPMAGRPVMAKKAPRTCPFPGCHGDGNVSSRFKRHATLNACPLYRVQQKQSEKSKSDRSASSSISAPTSPPSRSRSISFSHTARGRSPGKKRRSKSSRSTPGSRARSEVRSQSLVASPTFEVPMDDGDLMLFGQPGERLFDFNTDDDSNSGLTSEYSTRPMSLSNVRALDLAGSDDIESLLAAPALFLEEEAFALSMPDSPWDGAVNFNALNV
eukprot:m.40254 g.40254  ORF g.40254 m.40254 type:complete len:471 (-) comp12739_c0_seq1:246-1658(-)